MTPTQFVSGRDRLMVAPWHGESTIAYLSIPQSAPRPGEQIIANCCDSLRGQGITTIYTAALREFEAHPFVNMGFTVHETLHVLEHDLTSIPHASSTVHLRRAKRSDHEAVLNVDKKAFDSFWQLDTDGIAEALAATPSVRYRVADNGDLLGYIICGRAAYLGFIQRLAVDPAALRSGIGSALVIDALKWLKRRHVRHALVNTQPRNAAALALYEHLGFVRRQEPLLVLAWNA